MPRIGVYKLLILSLKDKLIHNYVCSDQQSVIEHIVEYLREYHNVDSDYPDSIEDAKIILKAILGKGYVIVIEADEIDSFISDYLGKEPNSFITDQN